MPRLRLLSSFAAVLAVTCAPAVARAQSIVSTTPARISAQGDSLKPRPDNQDPLGVSYADCVGDVTLQFPVQLSGFTSMTNLQVWASLGSGCVNPQDRGLSGGTAVCWGVAGGIVDPTAAMAFNVNVRVQDLVGWESTTPIPTPATPPRKGSEACTAQPDYPAVPMVINFLAIDGNGNPVGVPYQYAIETDLVGPPAPDICESVGDTIYNLTWTPNSDTDTVGYGVYIDPIPGHEPPPGQGDAGTIVLCPEAGDEASPGDDGGCSTLAIGSMPPDSGACGSAVSELTCNDSNLVGSILPTAPITSGDAGTPTSSGDAGDAGAEGGAVEVGPGGISTVSTAYLYNPANNTPNMTLPDKSTGSYQISGLVDYVTYSVVVTAVDGMGNIGPPSLQVCDFPAPVQDFWQVYEADGGGKGGYCALQTVGVGGPSLAGVAGVFVVAGVMRRRRKRR
jgi:hypothetical protein